MSVLKIKDENGNFVGVKVIKGEKGEKGEKGDKGEDGAGADLTGYAKTSEIPTKTSELENDSGFITGIPSEYITEGELDAKGFIKNYTETDPTVPSHVKNITEEDIAKWNSGTGGSGGGTTETVNLITGTVSNLSEPVKAGYQVDGKDVYVRRTQLDSLPTKNNYKDYNVGFNYAEMDMIEFKVLLTENAGSYKMLPVVHPSTMSNQIACYFSANKVRVYNGSGADTASMVGAVATVYFTYKN